MAEPDVKKALRDEEMSRMIASFTATTPPSDHRLIGSEHEVPLDVPLGPPDLSKKALAEQIVASPAPPPLPQTVSTVERASSAITPDLQRKEPPGTEGNMVQLLYGDLGRQIRVQRRAAEGRRIKVNVTGDIFSRVSNLAYNEKLDKEGVLTFLLLRYLPKREDERPPQWLSRDGYPSVRARHLSYFEDPVLEERLAWMERHYGLAKVDLVENVVTHALPPAPFVIPPKRRRKFGLRSRSRI